VTLFFLLGDHNHHHLVDPVPALVGTTVVLGGRTELLYAEHRVCTGVDAANLENGQGVVGWKETAIIAWLS
jgi:hypothetical protein